MPRSALPLPGQPQRLLIKPFRRGVILARHRHIARADKRIAVAVVELARLLVFLHGQREIAGLQRLVAFVDRQPVAGALDQALPLAAVVAVLVGGQRPGGTVSAPAGGCRRANRLAERAQHLGVVRRRRQRLL